MNKLSRDPNFFIGVIFAILGTIFFFIGIAIVIALGGEWVFLVFSLIGLIFATLGASFIGKCLGKQKESKRLVEENNYLEAEIIEIQPDWSTQINGQPVFRVIARYYNVDGTPQIYTSDMVIQNPDPLLTKSFVRVYYDSTDSNLYYMDLKSAMSDATTK